MTLSLDSGFKPSRDRVEALALDHLGPEVVVLPGSMRPFPQGWDIRVIADNARVGAVGYGASHGRSAYQLTGRGCRMVRDWRNVLSLACANNAWLTRLDVAVDFFGEYSVEKAISDAKRGKFTRGQSRRVMPEIQTMGTWHCPAAENKGRTVYIRSGGWQVMVYEKGIKEGASPAWVRVEVKVNREEGVALSALLNPAPVWLAYCPSLADLVAKSVPLERVERAKRYASLVKRLRWVQESCGPLLADLRFGGVSDSEIVDLVVNGRVGRRLSSDALSVLRLEGLL